jgi:hypothetical protein
MYLLIRHPVGAIVEGVVLAHQTACALRGGFPTRSNWALGPVVHHPNPPVELTSMSTSTGESLTSARPACVASATGSSLI